MEKWYVTHYSAKGNSPNFFMAVFLWLLTDIMTHRVDHLVFSTPQKP